MKNHIKDIKYSVFLIFFVPFLFLSRTEVDVVQNLLDVSVMVRTNRGYGSGTIFVNDNQAYVWTAAHIVNETKSIVIVDNNKNVYETELLAASYQDDIALLRVKGVSPFKYGTRFNFDVPKVGSPIYHVGCPAGQQGFNSFFKGIISYTGRNMDNTTYDQIACPVFYGCSGGGVFNDRLEYLGLISRFLYAGNSGLTHEMCLIIPSRLILNFAERLGYMYAVDHSYRVLPDNHIK